MEPGTLEAMGSMAALAVVLLVIFGIRYNQWIAGLEKHGHQDGYVSLLVAGGVIVVISLALLVVWPLGLEALAAVAVVGLLFIPAGIPMMIGSIQRHVAQRERDAAKLRAHAREVNTPGLGE
jgi:hypothetical protein